MKTTTRSIAGLAAAAALSLGTVAIGATAAQANDYAPVSQVQTIDASGALINGPLIEGPLVDIGGILNALKIGQFQ